MAGEHAYRGRRLFVALELPDYIKDSLVRLLDERRPFHWVPRERLHLTLKFIGDLPGQLQPQVENALTDAAQGVGRFLLPLQGTGRFPPKGQPHAVWAGVGTGHPRLFQLQKRIDDALFGIGIEPERHRYQPHITLARTSHAAAETVRQYLKERQDFEGPPFRVDHFVLHESTILDGRRHYIEQRRWDLLDT